MSPAASKVLPAAPALPALLEIFALWFSAGWIGRWHKGWQERSRQGQPTAPDAPVAAAPRFYQRLFSLRVTLWYLLYQRLHCQAPLAAVVANLRAGGADRLGRRGRSLSRRVRSAHTSAYHQARQRLPLELLSAALAHVAATLGQMVGWAQAPRQKPAAGQRQRQLLDGSTISILATPALAAALPPASNQHGASDWCMLRILVGFCARSGAVLSAVAGAFQQGEQALAWQLLAQAVPFTLWIGDRNFGVWSIIAQARRYRQDVLVRLTKARAQKLCAGRAMYSSEDRPLQWRPSKYDHGAPGTERAACGGRLLYVRVRKEGRWLDLWLFTTLEAEEYPLLLLVQWYGQRWQAELHFRSLKTQLKMAELDVATPEMAYKEFYAGLLAHSLVRAVLWAAGERLEEGLQRLSFTQARLVLLRWLEDWARHVPSGAGRGPRGMQRLLEEIERFTLPKRRKPRPSALRRVRHRRLKFPPLQGSRVAAQIRELPPKSL